MWLNRTGSKNLLIRKLQNAKKLASMVQAQGKKDIKKTRITTPVSSEV